MHAFERLWAVDGLEKLELEKEGLKVGAGEAELDAADAAGELQAAGMFGAGLQ